MDDAKPLIFIKPYSKTLEKLKEILSESAESQGIEIFEIDDVQEAIQIIPQLGQALIIAAHPRKTAQILQSSRVHIRKHQTKVLLISPKALPRRSIDKFMKVGLTECITEPIAPKTLQYKVNLLLRSISIKKEDNGFEQKFDSDSANENSNEMQQKKLHKNGQDEAEKNLATNDTFSSEKEKEQEKKRNHYQEESINGYYKGKVAKKGYEEVPAEESKNNSRPEVIEGYYKNKVKKREESLDDSPEVKEGDDSKEDDDIKDLAKRVNLLLDDEEDEDIPNAPPSQEEASPKPSKSSTEIELEDDEKEKELSELHIEDDSIDDMAAHHLDLVEDIEDKKKSAEDETESQSRDKKASSKLDIEAEEKTKKLTKEQDEKKNKAQKEKTELEIQEEKAKQKKKLEVAKEASTKKSPSSATKPGEEDKKRKPSLSPASAKERAKKEALAKLEIEKENRSTNAGEKKEKHVKERKKGASLDIEGQEEPLDDEASQEKEINSRKKKKTRELNVEKENSLDYGAKEKQEKEQKEREKAQDGLEIEDDLEKRKLRLKVEKKHEQKSKGDTEQINKKKTRKRDGHADDLKKYYNSRVGLSHGDDDWEKNEQDEQANSEKGHGQKSDGYTEEINDKEVNKSDAHADDLKKYYDSRIGLNHAAEDWEKNEQEAQTKEDKQKDNEFAMPEKANLGEQTIDYTDLKKQFDSIGYSIGSKKSTGELERNEDKQAKGLGFAAAITSSHDSISGNEEEVEAEEEALNEGEICEADIQSGSSLIKALSLYFYHPKDREAVINGILAILRDQHGALVAIKYGKGPHDGKTKVEMIGNWLNQESKDSIINVYSEASSCPILPSYSDKTFQQRRTSFFYPYTEGITTFAWAQCFFPTGSSEKNLKCVEALLETIRGALIDEFYELGGTGPYMQSAAKKKNNESNDSLGNKAKGLFGSLFGRKKAG